MKKLVKYLRGYVKETILGPLFKLCEATLELIVPLVIAAIIDNGINSPREDATGYIVKMCLLLVLMGAVGLAFSITAQYFSAKAAVGFVTKIKGEMFRKTQTLSYSDLDRFGTSTMITRMTADATKVQNGLNLTLRLLLRSPFVVFGAMIMAFTINTDAAWSFVIVIAALSVVVFGIMLITMPMYKRVQGGTDRLMQRTRENLAGVRVLRAFRKEREEKERFGEQNNALAHHQRSVGRISSLMNPLTYVLINLAILWLIDIGAMKVQLGDLSQGQVIALYNYMSQILVELIKLANLIISISKALASADRIADVLALESSERSGERSVGVGGDTAVEFKNVSLCYDGSSEPSLLDITFSVKKGQTVGIIGGTGSGKSSLVNMIPAFYSPTEGEILIDGYPVEEYDKEYLREHIGIVPQRAVLFRGSIRDNLKMRRSDATDEQLLAALEIAQGTEVVLDKGGLDAAVESGGKNFSGGQRQRLTIARALVGDPDILILDDSASALDFATDARLRGAIREMKTSSTVFIVSQRASSIMYADLIIVLDDGRAVGIGTHDELLRSCEVYREIYHSQFDEEVHHVG